MKECQGIKRHQGINSPNNATGVRPVASSAAVSHTSMQLQPWAMPASSYSHKPRQQAATAARHALTRGEFLRSGGEIGRMSGCRGGGGVGRVEGEADTIRDAHCHPAPQQHAQPAQPDFGPP